MEQGCIIGSGPSAPAGSVVQVCFPSVRAAVLDSLNRQREEGRLCDLSIQVQGQVFRAHRCVLAASSPYFHDQVLLKNVTTVSLPSVMDPVAFESVLSSAYTGQLSIVLDDIVNYVTVASFLQMWHIVDKCTEILKRPRPPVEGNLGEAAAIATHHGTSSRQQSPSSSDCLYMEREGKGKERRPYGQEQNALPPLATWRRPQQFPRWGRPRPPSQAPMSTSMSMPAQHLADSQLDSNPGGESDYSSCEEVWMSSNSKASPFGHDGRGQDHSHMIRQGGGGGGGGGGFPGEASRLRARLRQRGVPPTTEKLHGRDRGSGENGEGFGGELQEKRRNERGIEADEGMGEEVEEEKRARSERTGHSGDFHTSGHQGVQPERKVSSEELLKKEERKLGRGSDMTVEEEVVIPGPSCPGPPLSTRMPWQASPWSQQGARPHNGEDEDEEEEEEEVDFSRFADGAFGGDTYDEIEDGTGQVSQRPLVPASPVDSEFNLGAPELNWHSANLGQGGGGGAPAPTSSRHLSPPSPAPLPPSSSSPPIPSSSSSLSLAGAPYTGKVHFCHCGKAYTLKSMRDRHVKMQHLNLRPFTCPVCAKSFKMKHHLTKHLKTHGGLRPYECGHCGKKVIWRDSFLRHQARCERLAVSYDGSTADRGNAAAADVEDGYNYGFDEGEGFLSEGGQVKVEQVDFHGEVEGGMSGLLSGVSGDTGNDLGTHSEPRTLVSHGFKEEASERFS